MRVERTVLLICLVASCAHSGTRGDRDTNEAPDPSKGRSETVTAEDLERTPNRSIEEVLSSRFPGVVVTRGANGSLSIRIRGRTSIHGRTEPLFVIDDVPIEPGPGGALFGINPHDIESIEVLKDAAETTMYGVRGANGVVVIKTKRPD